MCRVVSCYYRVELLLLCAHNIASKIDAVAIKIVNTKIHLQRTIRTYRTDMGADQIIYRRLGSVFIVKTVDLIFKSKGFDLL